MNEGSLVKELFKGSRWGCLVLSLLFLGQLGSVVRGQDSVVVFNEVHYHAEGGSALEFVELHNELAVAVDVSNWRIDGDIVYDFPEGTTIPAFGYLVVAKDPSELSAATGFGAALGPYEMNLSNSGETLRLYNNIRSFNSETPAGQTGVANSALEGRRIMDELTFDDRFPWPEGPDGSGFSLAKRLINTGTTEPENWRTSSQVNGTPGAENTFASVPSVAFNEVSSSVDVDFELEIYNYGVAPVSLNGLVIRSSDELVADYVFPAIVLAPGDFMVVDVATLGFAPVDGDRMFLLGVGGNTFIDTVNVDEVPQARSPDGVGDWAHPTSPTFGSANVVVVEDGIVINEIFYHAKSQLAQGGSSVSSSVVIDYDGMWRYNLSAGDVGLAAGWAASAHAVDNVDWALGQGLLGEENASLGEPIRTDLNKTSQITYYFETDFEYNGTGTLTEMVINHYVDDGAIFYLNGQEIGRYNMDGGLVTPTTVANPGVGNATLRTFTVGSPNVLQGTNRLSVEVHQINSTSSDIVFGAQVTLREEMNSDAVPFMEREEEWVELFNRSGAAIDLSGWSLDVGIEYDFPAGTIIDSGEYLVIAKDAGALSVKHPSATIVGDYYGSLANSGELILLKDVLGNTADEVRYFDSGKWHGKADGGGSSLELRDPDSDNYVAGAWAASDELARSSWKTYTYEGVATDDGIGLETFHELQMGMLDEGELLIDDVSVMDGGGNELIQNGDFESDSVGDKPDKWRVIGSHGSHGRTVVVDDPDGGNQCLRLVATGTTENKHNKIETTFANDAEIVEGDTYTISYRARYLSGSNQLNSRLYFNYLQRTTIIDEPKIWGTPGAENSVYESNAGPTLSGLSHSPVVPAVSEPVTVGIDVDDNDGVGSVTLRYSYDGGAFAGVPMMVNAEGRYEGVIPGSASGTLVQFYVEASDGSNTSFYPAEAASGGTFYKVQDGRADTSGLRHNLRILMSEENYDYMLETTNRLSDDRLPATVIEDETTVYYNVAVRLKGSPVGRSGNSNHEYVIRFPVDQKFRGVHGSIAVERSALSQQLMSKHLHGRSGTAYASAYDDVAYIIPPDEGDRGLGLLFMARHSGTFFDSIHPDNSDQGTLFNHELHYSPTTTEDGDPESLKLPLPASQTSGKYDLKSYGPDKETIRWGFEMRSARDRDDYSRMIDLNDAFELEGQDFEDAVEEVADVDQWMRTFALMALNGNDDVFTRIWEHNFRFYVRPDGKIVVMQWDLDRAFRLSTTNASTILPTVNKDGDEWSVTKLFERPRFARLFYGHIDDLIETTFNSSYLAPWADEYNRVTGINMNGHLNYVTNRANLVDDILPASVAFEITTNSGADYSVPDSVVDLSGVGSFDVFSIEVNGNPVAVTWLDGSTWSISVPLALGQNNLTITAKNNQGEVVGSDSIMVTNTSVIDLADASNTIISELHYHASDPTAAESAAGFTDKGDFEYVELTNISNDSVDYTGVSFIDGVEVTIAAGTVLGAGETLVLVSNQDAFEFRYGAGVATVVGEYIGGFSNSGEVVHLIAADMTTIAHFTYSNDAPWPVSADGGGYSLVFVGGDYNNPESWRASISEGGNPGSTDSIPYLPGGDLVDYVIAVEPVISPFGGTVLMEFSVNTAADEASYVAEFSTDLVNWTAAADVDLRSLVVHSGGTTSLVYETPLSLGDGEKHFGRVRVLER